MLTPALEAVRFEKLWSMVDRREDDVCWPYVGNEKVSATHRPAMYWTWRISKKTGTRIPLRKMLTHVILYQLTGQWPKYVEHSCDNWACCNPAHLIESNHPNNMKTMVDHGRHPNQVKTHCPAGHPYAEFARYGTRGNGTTFRICKACERERTWKKRGAPGTRGPKRLPSATHKG